MLWVLPKLERWILLLTRIDDTFAKLIAEGKTLAYVMAGDPDFDTSPGCA